LRRAQLERAQALALDYSPLLLLLVLGIAFRLYLVLIYRPVAGGFNDSVNYLAASGDQLFAEATRMAGYPFFLRVLRYTVPDVTFVVLVQHLLGVVSGVLIYLCIRQLTGSRWLPALPAGFFLLSGDLILLEHSLLTESLYVFLVTAAICILLFVRAEVTSAIFLAPAGFALGAAWTVRTVALPLIGLSVAWLLLVWGGSLRRRLKAAATFAVPAAAVMAIYISAQGALTGFWGVLPGVGWSLYPRVAAIADCTEFDPPPRTEFLCEHTPTSSRPGPGYYQYVDGPGIRRFGNPFNTRARGSDVVGDFARAVVIGQPLDYMQEVGRDLLRYISPTAGLDRPYAGPGSDEVDLTRRNPEGERATIEAARAAGFDADSIRAEGGLSVLGDLQAMLRISGFALVALLGLATCGVIFARGPPREAALLLFAVALAQAVVAAATVSWGYRFGVVAMGDLVAAAAVGVWALARRYPAQRTPAPQS
jgi:hypothetical protein